MRLLLVGGGNMGMALLKGWIRTIPALQAVIIEPSPSEALRDIAATHEHIAVHTALADVAGEFDAVILAIKPQNFADVLPLLVPFVSEKTFVLSIAAGKTLAGMAAVMGEGAAIIRVMPNTPALIGEGMSVLVANAYVREAQKQHATALMEAVGKILWITDEEQMHAVTALSGSGPAYVFALIEAMQQAGEATGLPAEMALTLARQTVLGSAMLAEAQADTSPAALRRQVTSPGGTTEAALKVLQSGEAGDLNELMRRAIAAAATRSKELA